MPFSKKFDVPSMGIISLTGKNFEIFSKTSLQKNTGFILKRLRVHAPPFSSPALVDMKNTVYRFH